MTKRTFLDEYWTVTCRTGEFSSAVDHYATREEARARRRHLRQFPEAYDIRITHTCCYKLENE